MAAIPTLHSTGIISLKQQSIDPVLLYLHTGPLMNIHGQIN